VSDIDNLPPAELLVCVRCRRDRVVAEGERRPGEELHDHLRSAGLADGLTLTPVECLSNCSNGCTIALRGPGRWTYVYGNVDEAADVEAVRDGAARYRATADGLIPWRERPEHFKRNCVARVPPLGVPSQESSNA